MKELHSHRSAFTRKFITVTLLTSIVSLLIFFVSIPMLNSHHQTSVNSTSLLPSSSQLKPLSQPTENMILSNTNTSITTLKPTHSLLENCFSDRDCGAHSVCHLQQCRCFLGYIWSNVSQECTPIHCTSDEDCLSIAYTRCNPRNNLCQCEEEDYYLDWNSQSCRFSYLSSLQMIERSVPIVVVFVALILLSSAIGRCYYLRRRRSQSTGNDEIALTGRSSSTTTANFFSVYDQIVANDTIHYPPPPPYTADYVKPDEIKETDNEVSSCSHFSSPPPPYTTWN